MPDPAIVARGLERRFGQHQAVDGVDLEIAAGEVYGFLGPNGAGKSTVTRILCTLLAPTAGTAVVAGHDVARDPTAVRLRIGAALQEAALDDKQTGVEMLRLQGRFYGLTSREVDQRVAALRELIDIGDALDERVGTYSGGMKRRLDLALALVHNPEVLFLDEPTTGLDPTSRAAVWQEVRRLNRELGMTVFLTTQYLEEADALAGRVGIINRGRIVAEGTPTALKSSVGTDLVVVETSADADRARAALDGLDGIDSIDVAERLLVVAVTDGAQAVSPVALALDRAGVPVDGLTLRRPTLDDVFFRVTGQRILDGEEEPS